MTFNEEGTTAQGFADGFAEGANRTTEIIGDPVELVTILQATIDSLQEEVRRYDTDVIELRRVIESQRDALVRNDQDYQALREQNQRIVEEHRSESQAAHNARVNLEHFKNTVRQVTVDFPAGCIDGKRQFLEACGLELPDISYQVRADISFTFSAGTEPNYDEDDLQLKLQRFLEHTLSNANDDGSWIMDEVTVTETTKEYEF